MAPGSDGFADVGLLDDVLPTADPPVPLTGDRSIDDLALERGDPAAAGRIAAANGVENRRFPDVAELALPDSGGRAPAAFSGAATAEARHWRRREGRRQFRRSGGKCELRSWPDRAARAGGKSRRRGGVHLPA